MIAIIIILFLIFGWGTAKDLGNGLMNFIGLLVLISLLFVGWPFVLGALILWGVYKLLVISARPTAIVLLVLFGIAGIISLLTIAVPLAIVALIIVGIAAGVYWLFFRPKNTGDNSQSNGRTTVTVKEEPVVSTKPTSETAKSKNAAVVVQSKFDPQTNPALNQIIQLLTRLNFRNIRIITNQAHFPFQVLANLATQKYGFSVQSAGQSITATMIEQTEQAIKTQKLDCGVIITDLAMGERTRLPFSGGTLQFWNRPYFEDVVRPAVSQQPQLVASEDSTISLPEFRYRGEQQVPLKLDAGYQIMSYRFTDDYFQLNVLDKAGQALPTPSGMLNGFDDSVSFNGDRPTYIIPEAIHLANPQNVVISAYTNKDWDFAVTPLPTIESGTDFYGAGWKILPINLPNGNYLVRLVATVAGNTKTADLYTNVPNFYISSKAPVDTSHIYKIDHDDILLLQIRTLGAWELHFKALKLFQ